MEGRSSVLESTGKQEQKVSKYLLFFINLNEKKIWGIKELEWGKPIPHISTVVAEYMHKISITQALAWCLTKIVLNKKKFLRFHVREMLLPFAEKGLVFSRFGVKSVIIRDNFFCIWLILSLSVIYLSILDMSIFPYFYVHM